MEWKKELLKTIKEDKYLSLILALNHEVTEELEKLKKELKEEISNSHYTEKRKGRKGRRLILGSEKNLKKDYSVTIREREVKDGKVTGVSVHANSFQIKDTKGTSNITDLKEKMMNGLKLAEYKEESKSTTPH